MSALRAEALEENGEMEDIDSFRARARTWIAANLRLGTPEDLRWTRGLLSEEEELAQVARDRELQRMLFEGGLAGICFPREYGGQGLTPAHQQVLNEELEGRVYPMRFQVPTFSPCATVILEYGTEEQKLRHIPAILRGDELWMQFLSEPSGGSDVAGALDHRGARRRPVGGQRLEGVDHRGLVVRLGPRLAPYQLGRAQAPGPDRLHDAHPPARDRSAPH